MTETQIVNGGLDDLLEGVTVSVKPMYCIKHEQLYITNKCVFCNET